MRDFDIFISFPSVGLVIGWCFFVYRPKVVDDVVEQSSMSGSNTTMEPPPEDTVPSEQPVSHHVLKILFGF